MDESLLSNLVLPCRKSAAQASRAFADQLNSSDGDSQPGGSDGEDTKGKKGATSSVRRLKTYGKRRSPLKLANTTSTPAKSGLVSLEVKSSTRTPKPTPKPVVKRRRSPSISFPSSPLMKQSANLIPVGAEKFHSQGKGNDKKFSLLFSPSHEHVRKRARMGTSSSSIPDHLSDLTSLSHSAGPASSDSEVEILAFTPAILAPSDSAGNASKQVVSRQRVEPVWTSQDLGSYVWVLIEPTTARVIDLDKDQKRQDEYRMWWPGKITSASPAEIPLRVKLFGQKNVVIHEPSEANIVSKLDALGRWRYQGPVFVSSPQQTPSSSKRKLGKECENLDQSRCLDLENRWKNAVVEMKQAEEAEQDSDYLPDVGEISSWATSGLSLSQGNGMQVKVNGSGGKKGKRKRNQLSDEENGVWEPPPPDETLHIPGELVLGREGGRGTSAVHNAAHWPAKILAYRAPKHRKERPKYLVRWLDGTEGEIPRSWFYTMDEEEFAICKLGAFESSVVEVENDDEKEDLEVYKARWDFSRRSPSPEAVNPPPSIEEFKQLSIRRRFAYTKPVLTAIINKGYPPIMELHESFMAGGQKRGRLLEYSSRRGKMDPTEVSELTNYIKEWCLRSSLKISQPMANQENDDQGNDQDTVGQHEVTEERDLVSEGLEQDRGRGRSSSVPITEVFPSSPGEMPPSSFTSEYDKIESSAGTNNASLPDSADTLPGAQCMTGIDTTLADVGDTLGDDMYTTVVRRDRQRGCEEYEALTDLDKLNYCTMILLPESIRQLLLWQSGMRTSSELLSPEQEQELYEKGETLLNETEWVFNVKRMRQKAEGLVKRKGTGKRGQQPVNYRE